MGFPSPPVYGISGPLCFAGCLTFLIMGVFHWSCHSPDEGKSGICKNCPGTWRSTSFLTSKAFHLFGAFQKKDIFLVPWLCGLIVPQLYFSNSRGLGSAVRRLYTICSLQLIPLLKHCMWQRSLTATGEGLVRRHTWSQCVGPMPTGVALVPLAWTVYVYDWVALRPCILSPALIWR